MSIFHFSEVGKKNYHNKTRLDLLGHNVWHEKKMDP